MKTFMTFFAVGILLVENLWLEKFVLVIVAKQFGAIYKHANQKFDEQQSKINWKCIYLDVKLSNS